MRLDAVHHARRTTSPELVNRTNRIDSRVQCPSRVEVLLHRREQVFFAFAWASEVSDPRVRERFVGCHARGGIDGQAAADEFSGGERDAAPILEGREGVVGHENGLHFFEVGVPVKGRVAAEEEVGYYTDGPDVAIPN
jgi:hypothetical protein